jgi:hypothetical protein
MAIAEKKLEMSHWEGLAKKRETAQKTLEFHQWIQEQWKKHGKRWVTE